MCLYSSCVCVCEPISISVSLYIGIFATAGLRERLHRKKDPPEPCAVCLFYSIISNFFSLFFIFFFSRYFRLGSMRSLFAFFPLPLSRMQSTKSCNVWWSNRFWCDKSLECDFLLVRTKNAMNHVCIWSRSQVVPLLYAKWNYFKRTNRLFSIHLYYFCENRSEGRGSWKKEESAFIDPMYGKWDSVPTFCSRLIFSV